MPEFQVEQARCIQYELAIRIAASPARVWKGLADQLSGWWLPDFQVLGADSIMSLEPRAGGRLFEQNGDNELLWFTVLSIAPGSALDLVGHITADYGGPATSLLTIRLSEERDGTLLTLRDCLYGHVSDAQVQSLSSGWTQLFNDGLKAFVERA